MDHINPQEVAAGVAAAIRNSGLSKSSVAEKSGIPPTTFARKISGRVEFTASELLHIAAVLGVRPSTLIPGSRRSVAA